MVKLPRLNLESATKGGLHSTDLLKQFVDSPVGLPAGTVAAAAASFSPYNQDDNSAPEKKRGQCLWATHMASAFGPPKCEVRPLLGAIADVHVCLSVCLPVCLSLICIH